MITIADVEDIMLRDSVSIGVNKIQPESPVIDDKTGNGLPEEMIVVHVKRQEDGTYWKNGFVEVNVCVPNFKSGKRNKGRLSALSLKGTEIFGNYDYIVGEYNDTVYRYRIASSSFEQEDRLKCWYVNFRILFETIKVI